MKAEQNTIVYTQCDRKAWYAVLKHDMLTTNVTIEIAQGDKKSTLLRRLVTYN